ncbi:MAG TPA: glycogen-binding domain-containing protein [Phycisphaerales bacterium]|nr:glycogen-binding domain-containing protein [Phycisphaerales bacterium]
MMVTVGADGLVEFRLYRPHAKRVQVMGDFTRWGRAAVELAPEPDGWWSARLTVAQGDHLFSYIADDEVWVPDYAAHGIVPNGYGGWVSRLVVEVAAKTATRRLAA